MSIQESNRAFCSVGREREREREWAEEAFLPGPAAGAGLLLLFVVAVLEGEPGHGGLFPLTWSSLSLCRAASPCFSSLGAIRAMR